MSKKTESKTEIKDEKALGYQTCLTYIVAHPFCISGGFVNGKPRKKCHPEEVKPTDFINGLPHFIELLGKGYITVKEDI